MDKKEVGEKIREARESAGMTQESVAALFKRLTRQSVYNWETGASFPTADKWPALEKAFGKPAGWFLSLQTGGEYRYISHEEADLHRLEPISSGEALSIAKDAVKKALAEYSGRHRDAQYIEFIPVPKARAKLSAGGGHFVEEGFAGKYHFRADWLHSICSPADAILFECVGESMWPTINDKETVLVNRGDIEFQDGKIFAIGIGENALVKRLRLNAENMIEIISDNPDKNRFPTDVIDPEDIRILGRVKWHAGEL